MPPLPPVTQALLLINVGVFCLQFLFGGFLESWFALWPLGHGFLPWQLVTYSFLHDAQGFTHLFFNMLAVWMFGSELEQVWGRQRYLQYYFASVVAAGLVQFLLGLVMPMGLTVGASGAVFGLLVAYGMLFPNRVIMPLFPPIPMKARTFVILFGVIELAFGLFNMLNPIDRVAHFAHLGGALGGWLMIRYWRGLPPFPPRRRR